MRKVIYSPSKYIQGFGERKKLAKYFETLGTKGAYLLVDKFVLDLYRDDIESSFKSLGIKYHLEAFNGECSKVEINRHKEKIKELDLDLVYAIGGGKAIDTGKATSHYLSIPIVVVPTIASTDAPCSALSVIYTEHGSFEEYLFLKANPNIVIMDTEVIVNAPARLLAAGIGDALSTYFEAKACYDSNANSIAGAKSTLAALELAKLCLNTLFEDGYKAMKSCEEKVVTKAFENIVEANTYLSGIGFESGGLAAAHAIHNGLTTLEECHHMYHGEKVSFGTITQMVLENRSLEEIEEVIALCKSINLPTNLQDLGLDKVSKEKLFNAAKAAVAERETIHNMPFKVNAEDVYAAMLTASRLGK